jgi:CheY-like chemotaxis protein
VFSIRELMADIHLSMNELVTGKGLDFSYLVDEQEQKGCVIADMEKVRQVMTGLIGNAVKFTNSGSILFGCAKSEQRLDFFVQDTGLGISVEEQERIFDRFYQVRQDPGLGVRGTGLGLSIARGLAEVMGGDIQVESTPGQGSVFKLSIPFKKAEHQDVSPVSELHSTMDILTILIAEDEDFNYELMEILLAKKVRRLIRASNGTEVLSILQNEKPDLVLMDLKMPVMDGYEATQRARAIYPDLRIIALTAFTQPEDEHRAMAAGCCAFISKPIRKQELFETIRKNAK